MIIDEISMIERETFEHIDLALKEKKNHEENHLDKVASATTNFELVWPLVLLIQSDCKIL